MKLRAMRVVASLALAVIWPTAHADMLGTVGLINQNYTVLGAGAAPTDFSAPSAGVVSVTVTDSSATDNGFSAPFTSLQFAVSETLTPLTPTMNAGTVSLDLTAASPVYVAVFWTSDPTQGNYGMYNVTADFTPSSTVPLPGSAFALLSGCLLLLWLSAERLLPAAAMRRMEATVTSHMV
jgi:hypothetical protein